jgi:hypothetical protein
VKGRARDADHVFDAAREPVFVFQDREDDFGNAKRGDGQIIGAQAECCFADQPRDTGGEQTTHWPCDHRRQAEAAEIAGGGRIGPFDGLNRGIENGAKHEEADDGDGDQDQGAPARFGQFAFGENDQPDGGSPA